MAEQYEFWRKVVNDLTGPFPEIGLEPSASETIDDDQADGDMEAVDPKTQIGNLSRVSVDIYFFLNHETGKYYMMQGQNMWDYGDMTLDKALQMVRRKQGRKRG